MANLASKLGQTILSKTKSAASDFGQGMKGAFISANPAVFGPAIRGLEKKLDGMKKSTENETKERREEARDRKEEAQRAMGFAEERANEQKKFENTLLDYSQKTYKNTESIDRTAKEILELMKKCCDSSSFNLPLMSLPKISMPKIRLPQIEVPKIKVPEIEVPKIKVPEIELPKIKVPQIELPKIKVPQIELPKLKIPELELPRIKVPQIDLPKINVPQIELPKIKVPQIEVPKLKIPELEAIKLRVAEIEVPKITYSGYFSEAMKLPGGTGGAGGVPRFPSLPGMSGGAGGGMLRLPGPAGAAGPMGEIIDVYAKEVVSSESFLEKIRASVRNIFGQFSASILNFFRQFEGTSLFGGIFPEGASGSFSGMLESVKTQFLSAFETFRGTLIGKVATGVIRFLGNTVFVGFIAAIDGILTSFNDDMLTSMFNAKAEELNLRQRITGFLGGFFGNILGVIPDALISLSTWVYEKVSGTKIDYKFGDFTDLIKIGAGKIFGAIIGALSFDEKLIAQSIGMEDAILNDKFEGFFRSIGNILIDGINYSMEKIIDAVPDTIGFEGTRFSIDMRDRKARAKSNVRIGNIEKPLVSNVQRMETYLGNTPKDAFDVVDYSKPWVAGAIPVPDLGAWNPGNMSASMQARGIYTPDASAGGGRGNINPPGSKAREGWINVYLAAAKAGDKYPEITASQWALETGWGQKMPPGSNNPFGIKARSGEPFVEAWTDEFINGEKQRRLEKFKQYGSIDEAVADRVARWNPKYSSAQSTDQALQMLVGSNYATDPQYGNKLRSIISQQTGMGLPPTPVVTAYVAATTQTADATQNLSRTQEQSLAEQREARAAEAEYQRMRREWEFGETKARVAQNQLQIEQWKKQEQDREYLRRREALFEEFNNTMKGVFRPMVESLMGPAGTMSAAFTKGAGSNLSKGLSSDFNKIGTKLFGKQYGPVMGSTFQRLAGVYMDQFIDQTLAPMLGMNSDILNRSINTYLEGKSKYGQAIKTAGQTLATAKAALAEAESKTGLGLAELVTTAGTGKGFNQDQLARIANLKSLRANVTSAESALKGQKDLRNQYNMAALEDLIFGSTGTAIGPRSMIESYGGPERLTQDLATFFGSPIKPVFGLDEKDNRKLQAEDSLNKNNLLAQSRLLESNISAQKKVGDIWYEKIVSGIRDGLSTSPNGAAGGNAFDFSSRSGGYRNETPIDDLYTLMDRDIASVSDNTSQLENVSKTLDKVDYSLSQVGKSNLTLGDSTKKMTDIIGEGFRAPPAAGGGTSIRLGNGQVIGARTSGGNLANLGLNMFGSMFGGRVAQAIGVKNPIVGKMFSQVGADLFTGKNPFANVKATLGQAGSGGMGNALMGIMGLKNANTSSLGGILNTAMSAYQLYGALSTGSIAAGVGSAVNTLATASGATYGTAVGSQQSMMLAGQEVGMAAAPGSAGAAAGQFAAGAAGFIGGHYLGRAVSGGYSAGGSGNTAVNASTIIGYALGGPIGALVGGAVGGLVNRAFGQKAPVVTGESLVGTISGSGTDIKRKENILEEGGWFRSDDAYNKVVDLADDVKQSFTDITNSIVKSNQQIADALGGTTQDLTKVQESVNIVFDKTDTEQQRLEKITKAFQLYSDKLAVTANSFLVDYAKQTTDKDGKSRLETATETGTRLASAITSAESVLNSLGYFGDKGISKFFGMDVTPGQRLMTAFASRFSDIQDAFGGIDQFKNEFANLISKMFSPEETAKINLVALHQDFLQYVDKFGSAGGIQMPSSIPDDPVAARTTARTKFAELMQKFNAGEITSAQYADGVKAINAYLSAADQKSIMSKTDKAVFDASQFIPKVDELGTVITDVTRSVTDTFSDVLQQAYDFVNSIGYATAPGIRPGTGGAAGGGAAGGGAAGGGAAGGSANTATPPVTTTAPIDNTPGKTIKNEAGFQLVMNKSNTAPLAILDPSGEKVQNFTGSFTDTASGFRYNIKDSFYTNRVKVDSKGSIIPNTFYEATPHVFLGVDTKKTEAEKIELYRKAFEYFAGGGWVKDSTKYEEVDRLVRESAERSWLGKQPDADWSYLRRKAYPGYFLRSILPQGWDDPKVYDAKKKIDFINANNIPPSELLSPYPFGLGIKREDVEWMMANGYGVRDLPSLYVTPPTTGGTANTSTGSTGGVRVGGGTGRVYVDPFTREEREIKGWAAGGRYSGSSPMLVGEVGPELIIPSSSGYVISTRGVVDAMRSASAIDSKTRNYLANTSNTAPQIVLNLSISVGNESFSTRGNIDVTGAKNDVSIDIGVDPSYLIGDVLGTDDFYDSATSLTNNVGFSTGSRSSRRSSASSSGGASGATSSGAASSASSSVASAPEIIPGFENAPLSWDPDWVLNRMIAVNRINTDSFAHHQPILEQIGDSYLGLGKVPRVFNVMRDAAGSAGTLVWSQENNGLSQATTINRNMTSNLGVGDYLTKPLPEIIRTLENYRTTPPKTAAEYGDAWAAWNAYRQIYSTFNSTMSTPKSWGEGYVMPGWDSNLEPIQSLSAPQYTQFGSLNPLLNAMAQEAVSTYNDVGQGFDNPARRLNYLLDVLEREPFVTEFYDVLSQKYPEVKDKSKYPYLFSDGSVQQLASSVFQYGKTQGVKNFLQSQLSGSSNSTIANLWRSDLSGLIGGLSTQATNPDPWIDPASGNKLDVELDLQGRPYRWTFWKKDPNYPDKYISPKTMIWGADSNDPSFYDTAKEYKIDLRTAFGQGTSAWGGGVAWFDVNKIGTFAKGGNFKSNRPYIVGEVGPELMIPNFAGTVVPTHRIIEAVQDAASLDSKTRNLLSDMSPNANPVVQVFLDQQSMNRSLSDQLRDISVNSALVDNSVTTVSSPNTNIINRGDDVRSRHPVAGLFTRSMSGART